jgi:hypothetical protein
MVSAEGIHVDPSKVDAIVSWPTPVNIHDVRIFHGLASFIRDFITLVSRITEFLKGGVFKWTKEAERAFSSSRRR